MSDTPRKRHCDWLRSALQKRGFDSVDLAKKVGVEPGTVRTWLSRNNMPQKWRPGLNKKLELSPEEQREESHVTFAADEPDEPVTLPNRVIAERRWWEFKVQYIGLRDWPVPTVGGGSRIVRTDNLVIVTGRIQYTHNSPAGRDVAQYRTFSGGWVGDVSVSACRPSGPSVALSNVTAASLIQQAQRDGTWVHHEYEVNPGLNAEIGYKILGGFDEGNRDFHAHLCQIPAGMLIEKMIYRLNLTSYGLAGFLKRGLPNLHYSPADTPCNGKCFRRAPENLVPIHKEEEWAWEWEIGPITGGVYEVDWNDVLVAPGR